MSCGGCSGAVTRVLDKAQKDGLVSSFDVSLEKQQASVNPGSATYARSHTVYWSSLLKRGRGNSYDEILTRIRKTGKQVKSGTDASGLVYNCSSLFRYQLVIVLVLMP